MIKRIFQKKKLWQWFIAIATIGFFLIPIPNPLFEDPYSTILESKSGDLLSARIAQDGQWRFPEGTEVPEKFATCIRYFEDEYFYSHPGINPFALWRAAKQNWEAGRIVSGGSTLTMQVARLARKGKSRSLWQKLIELFWALRLEVRYSKADILKLYAAHAPFGGNVVGLEAAAWRYYQRPPDQLSWAEAATLAVLPNAPALIYPGKRQGQLLNKRNRLLRKLKEKGVLDQQSLELALSEGLPGASHHLPQVAMHLLSRSTKEGFEGQRIKSTLDAQLQKRLNDLVQQHYRRLRQNEIHNAAALILDNRSNSVLAYAGNSNGGSAAHGHYVDIINAKRSTGSLLKPLLYGLAWQNGSILPASLLPDVPTSFGGYAPKNFNKQYDGAVRASEALIRSLNVPAVRLLKDYGVQRFYDELKQIPFPSINRPADHYGLSIILGGAEASLWELCNVYKGLSNRLDQVHTRAYAYTSSDFQFPRWTENQSTTKEMASSNIKSASIWQLVESLKEVNRPGQEEGWESFAGRRKVAWKTGTSFGLRDAWAIGICPEYTIGVWVGNADGEGRPGLTGIRVAAPLLFEAFELLGESSWYQTPYDELYTVDICPQSGYLKGPYCEKSDTVLVTQAGKEVKICPYHQQVQLDRQGQKRVNSSCYAVADMQQYSAFVLPPLMEWYYRKKEPSYQSLPPWQTACVNENRQAMEFISPEQGDQVLIPVELGGEQGRLVVEVAHRNPNSTIYWHLDDEYIGESTGLHSKEMNPTKGKHLITLIDAEGNILEKRIKVIE